MMWSPTSIGRRMTHLRRPDNGGIRVRGTGPRRRRRWPGVATRARGVSRLAAIRQVMGHDAALPTERPGVATRARGDVGDGCDRRASPPGCDPAGDGPPPQPEVLGESVGDVEPKRLNRTPVVCSRWFPSSRRGRLGSPLRPVLFNP